MLAAATQQASTWLRTLQQQPQGAILLIQHTFCFSLFPFLWVLVLLSLPRLGAQVLIPQAVPSRWMRGLQAVVQWGAPHILTAPFWAGCTGGHNTFEVTGEKTGCAETQPGNSTPHAAESALDS